MEALPSLKEVGTILSTNGGPFCQGDTRKSSSRLLGGTTKFETASYADFVIVSWLHFLKRIDENIYAKVVKIEPAYEKVYNASAKWLEHDGH